MSMSLTLVTEIERAVRHDRVTSLARTAARLGAAGSFASPEFFLEPRDARYARKLVWHDPERRFVIVGMTWAPGQKTELHDHGGLWGVEIVVRGTMRETSYRVAERDADGRMRFVRASDSIAPEGTAGVLVPPHDHHVFENVGSDAAYTVHVYGGSLETCNVYEPESGADGWYRARKTPLSYDA